MRENLKRSTLTKILLIIILVMMVGVLSFCLVQETYALATDEQISHLTEEEFQQTNYKNPNGVDVQEYAAKNYGVNSLLYWESGIGKRMDVYGSDDIVKLIPEYLFKEVGVTQHIGKKYGIYV